MSSGGGSSAPTEQKVTQITIPPELMPYAKKTLGTAEDLAYNQPYQTYGGQRLAGLNPLQQQGIRGTAALGPTSQIGQASGLAGFVGQQAGQMGASYQPMQYQPTNVSYMGTQAPQLQQYQMGPAERVGADRFGSQAMQDYMSPYMSGVVAQQKRGAMQDFARQMPGLRASAARSGALGGTRESLMRSEAQRNLQGQLQGIEATGLQNAFQQAQQQFGADRAAQMQASLANKLVIAQRIDPCMSEVYSWSDIPKAHMKMLKNEHRPGNMAVLVGAPRTGLKTYEDAVEAASSI